ncbi:MAG: EthD domain-containing protein [Hyphomicrobiaceae bacterium]
MIKSMSLLTRKPGMTVEAFRKVWIEEHAPMVRSVPEVRRYVLTFPLAEPTRPDVPTPEVQCDAIAELWYDDMASLQKASASAAMKRVTDNGARYLGTIKSFVLEEVGIIG